MLSTLPPLGQERLAALLAERVDWVTGAPADPSEADTTVLVLLRELGPADLFQGAREFAAGLAADEAAAWRRSWTRTRFLFGNPANLPPGQARLVAPGATAAWLGPFPDRHRPGLSRLLKPVSGALPQLPPDLHLPTGATGTAGNERVLQVAIDGMTLVDYLVHLHHTVAEAVLLGRLRPDEPVRLTHRPEIDSASGPPAYARVLPEPGDTGRLRPYTWLSSA